ncbi:hypothetical protein CLPUN_46280 [Clostridium puniceum]|uniref:YqbQ/XkdQ domain-containing protein n=1 Tax=Clostridium puniceum TaxID=29367 RepID=A0A1S8T615_9CLOT|nr:XkdQ [Clostridium puniceum]OOM72925.1 hypothetical protein CLPUN_46280 [Clostridium puniceum]
MDLVLKNKYKLQIVSESVTLKEAIDGIAYTLSISLIETEELANIGISKGDSIELYDYAYQDKNYTKIFCGVIWDIDKDKKNKKISLTGKERTRVIEESEDEYLWSEGQTASQRGTIICNDWGIPIGNFLDTGIGLSKDKRKESLYGMMKKDLKETAQKSGGLYKFRMDTSLNLVELGSNSIIYKLDNIIDDLKEKDSLEGAITQIKVLGKENTSKKGKSSKDSSSTGSGNKQEKELVLSPVIGVFKRNTEGYGTLQKIIDDDKVDDYAKAQSKADCLFSSGESIKSLNCCEDINTLRAGDFVSVYGENICVTEITHTLGSGGKMSLTVMKMEDVRRKFYSE